MSTSPLTYRVVLTLTLEELAKHHTGQYIELVGHVLRTAELRKLIPDAHRQGNVIVSNPSPGQGLPHDELYRAHDLVGEAMWDCILKRIIVPGTNQGNGAWPFYRVTGHGAEVLRAGGADAQPYDPDGFLAHFDKVCSGADPTVRSYLVEAVRAFNADCTRSAAVMLGCASEKLLLLLCDAFEAAIADATKKAKFEKDINARWMASNKYAVLKYRLDLMVTAKKLPRDEAETVAGELPAGFEFLRRCRNAAGHPDVPGNVETDTVFFNLRTFVEYARRMQALIAYFVANPADW